MLIQIELYFFISGSKMQKRKLKDLRNNILTVTLKMQHWVQRIIFHWKKKKQFNLSNVHIKLNTIHMATATQTLISLVFLDMLKTSFKQHWGLKILAQKSVTSMTTFIVNNSLKTSSRWSIFAKLKYRVSVAFLKSVSIPYKICIHVLWWHISAMR